MSLLLGLVAGFIGGVLFAWIFRPRPVLASQPGNMKAITAQEFKLLDEDGSPRAGIGVSQEGVVVLDLSDKRVTSARGWAYLLMARRRCTSMIRTPYRVSL